MERRPQHSIEWRRAPEENFTGEVWFGDMSGEGDDDGVRLLGVQFTPGARTGWHSHPSGQVLHVVSGSGIVADDAGQRLELLPGDTVTTPAGTVHWHGAAPGSPMLHLSITSGGATEWTGVEVTEEEYGG